jgi:hypothetical protein
MTLFNQQQDLPASTLWNINNQIYRKLRANIGENWDLSNPGFPLSNTGADAGFEVTHWDRRAGLLLKAVISSMNKPS